MKVIAEYLEHALTFERMADQAADANLKRHLLRNPLVIITHSERLCCQKLDALVNSVVTVEALRLSEGAPLCPAWIPAAAGIVVPAAKSRSEPAAL
jgi:hypothetical protein